MAVWQFIKQQAIRRKCQINWFVRSRGQVCKDTFELSAWKWSLMCMSHLGYEVERRWPIADPQEMHKHKEGKEQNKWVSLEKSQHRQGDRIYAGSTEW